ncbi:MAG: hypothetical protein IPH84_19705 [Bacteroidales bacterium]|nr:hypothetical protein [Bacteroidales bacterium]
MITKLSACFAVTLCSRLYPGQLRLNHHLYQPKRYHKFYYYHAGTLETGHWIPSMPQYQYHHKCPPAGTYVTTLAVVDGNNCASTVTDSSQRSPCIVAAYTPSDTLLCQNYALAFSDFSTCDAQISQWVWT